MNEVGHALNDSGSEKVIGDASVKRTKAVVSKMSRTSWLTALKAISAAGSRIDPLIVTTGKNV